MEKRYQVFVSSTFIDLQEERRQVMQALLELDCIPAGMELFPAADETQWVLIKRVIDDCDYYVVIIGGRYGSTDDEGVSYTEREYDYAIGRRLPVLGFVHADPSSIPAGRTEIDAVARQKLEAFRAKVQRRLCKSWRTPEELGGVVSRSLVQAMKTTPAEGWVRARNATAPEQINALRAQVDDLTSQLEAVRTAPPPGAEGLAKGGARFTIHFSYKQQFQDYTDELILTWDEIFALVGPAMFGEASEHDLKEQLQSKYEATASLAHIFALRVDEEDFQTIKVQLLALGLIQKSERKRTASDTKTYWKLTPYGETYAMVLKAIRSTE